MNLDDPFFLHMIVYKRLNKKLKEGIGVKMGRELETLNFETLKKEITSLDGVFSTQPKFDNPERKSRDDDKDSSAGGGKSKDRDGRTPCDKCGRKGHTTEKCRMGKRKQEEEARRARLEDPKTQTEEADHSHITCFKCQEKGHYASACPKGASKTLDHDAIKRKLRALRAGGQAQEREEGAGEPEITADRIAQALYDWNESLKPDVP